MKIVHLCLSCFFVDNYSYQENMLAKYHAKMGYEVTIISSLYTLDKNGKGCLLDAPSEKIDKDGFKVIRLAYSKPVKIFKILRKYIGLYHTLQKESPDIIFVHGLSFSDATIVVKYIKSHPNVVLYADSHTDFINSGRTFLSKYILHSIIWRYYAKKLEPFLKKCYGVTPLRCTFLKDVYNIDEKIIDFLPMGVDDDSIPTEKDNIRKNIRNELGLSDNDILIFTGGKIGKLKNTDVLIKALNLLSRKNVHLVICGILLDEMQYLKKEFNSNIHYIGWCNAQEVINYMLASDMACYPGTHSVLWEQTVGLGLPCIFKKWESMTHVNINGNCEFIKGEDVDELKSKLKEFFDKNYLSRKKDIAQKAACEFLYSTISKKAIDLDS